MQKINEALKADKQLTCAECDTLLAQLEEPQREVSQRIAEIRPARRGSPAGTERRRVMQTGTIEAVRELDSELSTAEIRAEQLRIQRDTLIQRRNDARAREASEALPAAVDALESEVEAIERLANQLAEQRDGLRTKANQLNNLRSTAVRGGHPAAGASSELAHRVIAQVPSMQRHAQDMAERMGAEPEQVAA